MTTKNDKPRTLNVIVTDCRDRLQFVTQRKSGHYDSSSLSRGELRCAFEKIWKPGTTYTLLQTAANPAAMQAVHAHQKTLLGERGYDEDDDDHCILFDTHVRDEYLDVASMLSGKKDMRYALVQGDPYNAADPALWPIVHVLEQNHGDNFVHAVRSLNNDASYAMMTAKEAPQNYRLGVVNLLREKEIEPIVAIKQVSMSSAQLKSAIDFLCLYSFSDGIDHGPGIDVD